MMETNLQMTVEIEVSRETANILRHLIFDYQTKGSTSNNELVDPELDKIRRALFDAVT